MAASVQPARFPTKGTPFIRPKEKVMFGLLLIVIGLVLVGALITYDHLRGRV
jgi:hypothetical protein